ncbi:MAG: response regulator transcription factor [Myxococcota bacterium]
MPTETERARLAIVEAGHGGHILLVEDDLGLADLLTEYLSTHGFRLSHANTGPAGAERILAERPDLVLLDLMLPGDSGLDVCRRVRSAYRGAIVMLTASQSEADHIAGLELGADDFVIKPIEPRVLLARIRAQLRRLGGSDLTKAHASIELGELRLDVAARSVQLGDEPVGLTHTEFEILRILLVEAGTVVGREELYQRVLRTEYDGIDRGMDVHVSRIRRKLERAGFDPSRLKSVRGLGYLLTQR